VDLNGDGYDDIFSGSYSRTGAGSMAGLFQVLWGQPDGTFKKAVAVNGTDDEPLIIPIESRKFQTENICTRPTAVDWDADGDLDLVVGNFAGSFYLFIGKGEGKFQPKPQLIMSGEDALKIESAHSDPFVVDWDNDGDLDLLSGSSKGGVQWAENGAAKGKSPELKPFQPLIEPGTNAGYGKNRSERDLVGPSGSTRIWVDDVNADGKLDVIVGDSITLVSPAKGLSEEEFEKKNTEWQEAFRVVSLELSTESKDPTKRQGALQRYRELYSERSEFMSQERTGFVWLFLQK
jgi:hypothetical protein